jgi:hypothetical protein
MNALRVVVHGDREFPLGWLLPDYVLVEEILNLKRLGDFVGPGGGGLGLVVFENGVADGDALIANVGPGVVAGGRDQLPNNILALMAEGTSKCVIGASALQ